MSTREITLCAARRTRAALVLVMSLANATAWSAPPRDIEFNRDVRPILSDRCFGCHGPDGAKRKAGLRLDTQDGARALLGSGLRALVAHDVGASEVARRITSTDPEEIMPPPALKRPLSDEERSLLLRWIESGAEYEPHWAFVAPAVADAPVVNDAAWARDAFDRHVQARLEQDGRKPAAEASREVLLRRVTLAITGLNPTPEEVDAFIADASVDAYEKRVDALLASSRAAEHAAVAWLDLARYADSFGYQSDGESFTWPWRDWLLNALQTNTRYDTLATAMTAGDLLTNARIEDKVASAFNRLHRMTEEGGSIREEFRMEAIADRVATWGTTFLGLTLECARCHDHKYDPIPTLEFYGLAAMFGAIDENGLKPYIVPTSAPPPFVRLTTEQLDARTRDLESDVARATDALELAERAWASDRDATSFATGFATSSIELPTPAARYSFESLVDGKTPNDIDVARPATTDRPRPEQLGAIALNAGRVGNAVHFDGDGGLSLAGIDGISRHDAFSCSMWIRPSEVNARAALLHSCGFYTNDADTSGIELLLHEGRVRWSVVHLWPGSAASIEMRDALALNEWTHITATYDGSSRAEGLRIYANGRAIDTELLRDELDGPIATHTLELGSRSRDAGFRGGAIDELAAWRSALTACEVALAAGVEPLDADRAAHAMFKATHEARANVRTAERALAVHLDTIPSFMCMQDSPHASEMFVLTRGAYDQPDHSARVNPGALEAVLPFDPALTRNRLGLAQWLFDARNPLASRVAVNRLWTQVFGRGLVETNENFGVQGAWPAQREVLDLLACEFQHGDELGRNAWDCNAMLRRLVLSATFRQSSSTTVQGRELDPTNDALTRGPSSRLTAEMLRDCALAAAGLLVEKVGGPSVRPFQQASLATEAGQNGDYVADSGANAHRRSLYTVRKRTVPPPSMLVFDAGSREACLPRRGSTNTPLQTLVLLNDPIFVECARALAVRVTAEIASPALDTAQQLDARLTRAFRLACARAPRLAELDALRALVRTQTLAFTAETGSSARLTGIEDPELAALTLACSTLFASDAFVISR